MVRDKNEKPVLLAKVIFTIRAGGGKFSNGGQTYTAYTWPSGIAEATLILGEKTEINPIYCSEEGQPYSQQVGQNLVDVSLANGTSLNTPFVAFGHPDAPYELKMLYGDQNKGYPLGFAGPISILLVDRHQNPISNKKVIFKALKAQAEAGCFPANETPDSALLVQLGNTCLDGILLYNTCSSKGGAIEQTVMTSHEGAVLQVFLGGIAQAAYPITAQSEGVTPVTFQLYSTLLGDCSDNHPPLRQFLLTALLQSDHYGNNINAGKAGTKLNLKAMARWLLEGEKVVNTQMQCDTPPVYKPCIGLAGTNIYRETKESESMSVTFRKPFECYWDQSCEDPLALFLDKWEWKQDGALLENGIFSVDYPLPDKPERILIYVNGKSKIKTNRIKMDCAGCSIEEFVFDSSYEPRIDVLGSGKDFLKIDTFMRVLYSVDITVPEKVVVNMDEAGLTIVDARIDYTILPASYKAATAYILIYKDNVLETYMPTETAGQGFGVISKGYAFDQDKAYEAEVVLNYNTGNEIRSKRIPIQFQRIYIETKDRDFPNTKLKPFDFYPALGSKNIIIIGRDTENKPIAQGRVRAELITPAPGTPQAAKVTLPNTEVAFNGDGKAVFRLEPHDLAPPLPDTPNSGLDQIEVKFTYYAEDNKAKGSILGRWTVRNNSNVKMKEVWAGEAVFVFDDNAGNNHKGVTPANVTDDGERYFDFVQELLNQVVPRKRSLGNLYNLLDENGIFNRNLENPGSNTLQALYYLKEHFHIDNTSNAQCDFRKLMKDYNIPEADHLTWTNKIVDKRTLAGDALRVEGSTLDNRINGTAGNAINDTGLYELYVNVVKRFVDRMISYGETYENDTTNFKSRTGSSEQGVSYCYGCNDNLGEYQGDVSSVVSAPAPVPIAYRGDTAPVDPGKKYAGLYQNEKEQVWDPHFRTAACDQITEHKFYPQHWAGIDCSGIVQRMINHADVTVTPASPIPGVNTRVWNLDAYQIVCNANGRYLKNRSWNNYFFDEAFDITKHISLAGLTQQQKDEKLKLLKKGDLIHYSGHVSTVYSERAIMVGTQTRYQIIHAYGSHEYTYPVYDVELPNQKVFSRKVIVTWQNVSIPQGFGRIKLWN